MDNRALYDLATECRNWVGIIGILYTCFRAVSWVKEIKSRDLPNIQACCDNLDSNLKAQSSMMRCEFKEQTIAVVGELKELRGDMRTLVGAFITPQVFEEPRLRRKPLSSQKNARAKRN